MSNIFEQAVKLTNVKGAIKVGKASTGGYIPTADAEMDEMIGAIIESKLPIDQYSFWLVEADAADFKQFGIKSKAYTDKSGQKRVTHDGNISPASFKKLVSACEVNVELVKRPFPQPKLVARIPGKAKVAARSDNRIGK
jgi:hypothetical protein